MAKTVQLHRTRAVDTFTKTAIDQKQSLDVVQTMLHGGLSSISYLRYTAQYHRRDLADLSRSLFPEKAFDERMYEMGEHIQPYEDYAAGNASETTNNAPARKTLLQVLRRKRSRRVDMFLDWLENGAFAALKQGNLQAIQVYVHADPTDREKVIETYTFTIKYMPDGPNGRVAAGVQMDSQGSSIVSVGATNSALHCLLREVMDLCEQLPELPEKRFISMSLLYSHRMDESDPPKGFVPGTMNGLFFAEAEGWEKNTQVLEHIQAGYHDAVLKIAHLHPRGQKPHPALKGVPPRSFPRRLLYPASSSVYKDVDLEPSTSNSTESHEVAKASVESMSATPSTVVEEIAAQQAAPASQFNEAIQSLVTPGPTSDMDTQSSNIPGMTRAFRDMMQSEHLTQGDTQTQATIRLSEIQPVPSETSESETCSNFSPSKRSELASPAKANEPLLSQQIATRLEKAKHKLHQTASNIAKEKGYKKKRSELVLCQCGCDKEEGDMVNCVYCETWQHLHCYGYTGESDRRLPTSHVCYQCLVGDHDEDTLNRLRGLAQKRRGMYLALENGLRTKRDFATDMGLPMSLAGRLYDQLVKQGYVVPAAGSHKSGYHASGKPLFVSVKEGPKYNQMLNDLFEPMLHISHQYELPTSYKATQTSLAPHFPKSQMDQMGPPATPASQLKKMTAKTSGSTSLDLRASVTPFETPMRPRSRQLQSLKRHQDEGEFEQILPKRMRHTNSVQTEYLLDAGGLSSSPATAY